MRPHTANPAPFRCPKCGSPTNALSTHARRLATRRTRVCRGCGHRFLTTEIASPAMSVPQPSNPFEASPMPSDPSLPSPREFLAAWRSAASPAIRQTIGLVNLLPVSDRVEFLQYQLILQAQAVESLSEAITRLLNHLEAPPAAGTQPTVTK